MHRAEGVQINPADAAARGIEDGSAVSMSANGAQIILAAEITEEIPAGAVWTSSLAQRGAVQSVQTANAERLTSVGVAPAE